MDKYVSFYVTVFVLAVVTATVTSFGGGANSMGSGSFGGDNFNRKFQTWLDKRGFGQSHGGFGSSGPLGSENRYFNWKDYYLANSGISKRQLNYYGPRSFGNFQKYFTDGLQDWKSTYTGMGLAKREAPASPDAAEHVAADASQKEA